MTYPMTTLSEAVSRLQLYLADERPMNLQELKFLLDVIEPVAKAAKNITMNVRPQSLPGWLLNDFIVLKQKI